MQPCASVYYDQNQQYMTQTMPQIPRSVPGCKQMSQTSPTNNYNSQQANQSVQHQYDIFYLAQIGNKKMPWQTIQSKKEIKERIKETEILTQ